MRNARGREGDLTCAGLPRLLPEALRVLLFPTEEADDGHFRWGTGTAHCADPDISSSGANTELQLQPRGGPVGELWRPTVPLWAPPAWPILASQKEKRGVQAESLGQGDLLGARLRLSGYLVTRGWVCKPRVARSRRRR